MESVNQFNYSEEGLSVQDNPSFTLEFVIREEQIVMSTVKLFRNYIRDYHSHLALKDWKLEKRSLSIKDTTEDSYKQNKIPRIINQELIYWAFFYDVESTEVVYLLQNKKNLQFISITLFSNGKLSKPISLM